MSQQVTHHSSQRGEAKPDVAAQDQNLQHSTEVKGASCAHSLGLDTQCTCSTSLPLDMACRRHGNKAPAEETARCLKHGHLNLPRDSVASSAAQAMTGNQVSPAECQLSCSILSIQAPSPL